MNNHTVAYSDYKDEYRIRYETIRKQRKIALEAAKNAPVSLDQYRLKPNSMQVDFINNLSKMIDDGEDKALLISATG